MAAKKNNFLFLAFVAFIILFPVQKIGYAANGKIPTGKILYKVTDGNSHLVGMEFLVDFDSHDVSGTHQYSASAEISGQQGNKEVYTNTYRVVEGSFDPKTEILHMKIDSTSKVDKETFCEKKTVEHSVTYVFETTITASLIDDKFNRFAVTPEITPNTSGFVTLAAPISAQQISEDRWFVACQVYSAVGKRKPYAIGDWEAVPKDKLKEYLQDKKSPNGEKPDKKPDGSNIEQYTRSMSAEQASRFQEIAKEYLIKIPTGKYQDSTLMKPGQLNNLFGDNERVCGAYQGLVLRYLHGLRFHKDPGVRKLLDEFDYGPIQIYRGAHQAVVLFPKGTDWRETGIVLDPWINQKPELYRMDNWRKQFLFAGTPTGSLGNWITPIKTNQGRYPTTPNADGTWTYVDEFTETPILPNRDEISRRRRMVVQSPVNVLVESKEKKIGIDQNGQFVNDFGEEADAYFLPKPEGAYSSSFNLPEKETYHVTMVGIGSGEMRVYANTVNGDVIAFNPVQITEGGRSTLQWGKTDDKPMLTDQKGIAVAYRAFVDPKKTKNNYFLAGGIIGGIIIVGGTVILLFRRRKEIVPSFHRRNPDADRKFQ